MERLSGLPLLAQPGEDWLYGTGSNIQGVLVARASGLSLSRFCEERIFRPLGMKDTAYFVPPAKIERLADEPIAAKAIGSSSSMSRRPESGAGRPRLSTALPGWYRQSTTISRSRACCSPTAGIGDSPCSGVSPSISCMGNHRSMAPCRATVSVNISNSCTSPDSAVGAQDRDGLITAFIEVENVKALYAERSPRSLRSVASAAPRSEGAPQMPGPVRRIAP